MGLFGIITLPEIVKQKLEIIILGFQAEKYANLLIRIGDQ